MRWRIPNYRREHHGVTGIFDVNIYIPPVIPHTNSIADLNCYGYVYITLKIFYERDNAGTRLDEDFDSTRFMATAWPDSAWSEYTNRIRTLSRFWDSRFWLVLNSDRTSSSEYQNVERHIALKTEFINHPVSGGRQILVYPRTIICKFNLEILTSVAGAHKHIRVAYIVDRATGTTTGVTRGTNRSNASYYDSGDVISESSGYNTIIHELGHAIGIPHIGVETRYAACLAHDHPGDPDRTNHADCYEGPLGTDIMGTGSELNWHDAIPWRFALQELTTVPHEHYTVQQRPMVSTFGEMITEGTSRWTEFHEGPSWWS